MAARSLSPMPMLMEGEVGFLAMGGSEIETARA
jgi:hypothetical protein